MIGQCLRLDDGLALAISLMAGNYKGGVMKLTMVDPKALTLDKDQPRESLDKEHIEDITRKMVADGFDETKFVIARKLPDGTLMVLHGAHRTVGSMNAGLKEIPVYIKVEENPLTKKEEAKLRLSQCADNMGKNMKPMELVLTAEESFEAGLDIQEIAASLGKTPQSIQNDRILARAPGRLQQALTDGELRKSVVRHIAEKVLNGVVTDVEKSIKKAKMGGKKASLQIKTFDAYVQEVITSKAAQTGNMFNKDDAATKDAKKTQSKQEKNFVCVHNGRDWTLENTVKMWESLKNMMAKYTKSPNGNGESYALMTAHGAHIMEIKQVLKSMNAIAKKITGDVETYEAKIAANG